MGIVERSRCQRRSGGPPTKPFYGCVCEPLVGTRWRADSPLRNRFSRGGRAHKRMLVRQPVSGEFGNRRLAITTGGHAQTTSALQRAGRDCFPNALTRSNQYAGQSQVRRIEVVLRQTTTENSDEFFLPPRALALLPPAATKALVLSLSVPLHH